MRNLRNTSGLGAWSIIALSALLAVMPWDVRALGQTWIGSGVNNWNAASNWSPATVPNSATAAVIFGNTAFGGNVNISASVSAESLSFTASVVDYTLTSSAGDTLSSVQSITEAAGVTGTDTVNIANVATGSLLFASGGNLTITNNSTAGGGLVVGPNTIIGTPGGGGVIFAGPGTTTFSGSFANSSASDEVEGGLTKTGPGLLDYIGSGATLTGPIVDSGGTLDLDYSTNTASKLETGALDLDGGVLELTANSGTPVTQAGITGMIVNAGQTTVQGLGAGTIALAAGAITRSVGATADFAVQASGPAFSVTTSTTTTNSLLGAGPAFATVDGGATWATESGGAVAGLGTYGTNTYTTGTNVDVTTSSAQTNINANSLRFNTGAPTLTLSGTNTLQSGGILATPNSTGATITGGTLTAPSSGELIVQQYGVNPFTINSALVSTAGLTKGGPGFLTLGGTNTGLTGPININRGGLVVTATAAVNSASAINFNDDRTSAGFGGLQELAVELGNGVNGAITPPITLSAFSSSDYGTYFSNLSTTASTVTLGGVISSAPGLTTPIRFDNSGFDTPGFDLTNANNTFTGNVSVEGGFLGINSNASLGNAANNLFLEVGDTVNGGLVFLNSGITVPRTVTINEATRIVSNGTDSNTISGPITSVNGSSSTLVKDGTGTLTISNLTNNLAGGGVQVTAGTLSLGSTGTVGPGTNITVESGATFSPGTSNNAGSLVGTVTLNGGTFSVSSGSQVFFANQIVAGTTGGTVNYTGAGAAVLFVENPGAAITINGNSTWLSPANGATIEAGDNGAAIPINIASGVTLTNGIALTSGAGYAFQITGGGTLFQDSDATNVLSMSAPITVSQGEFRVTDASSNGGVGNLGTGTFILDGGTFSYGGTTATTSKPISITSSGGTIQVESAATTLIDNGAITGGGLTKIGPGTLLLGTSSNTFSSLTINAGTVETLIDSTLGTGPVTVAAAGTLAYSGTPSTSRTLNLNDGTLLAVNGATVTLNGAAVNGGFMRGPGIFALTNNAALNGVTTFSSSIINQTGAATLTNATLGGTFNNSATASFTGVTTSTLGILNVNSSITTQDFTSDGVINVVNGASITNSGSNFGLGGGARMFIGTKTTPGGTLTLQNSTTLEVNGALLVNDGTISGTTDVNYGGQAQGIGTYGTVNVSYGGVYQPGFASSAIPANGSTVSGLAGNGTIDNATAGGNMGLTITGSSVSTFSGPIQNTTGTLSLAIQGTTSLTLLTTPLPGGGNSTNTYAGGTSIASGGTLTIGASGALPSTGAVLNNGAFIVNANSTSGQISGTGALTIGANTALSLATSTGASAQDSLILNTGSQLNLTNNDFVIHNGTLGTVTAPGSITNEIAQARNTGSGGLWSGSGITSSTAAATPTTTALGVLSGAQFLALHPGALFEGNTVASTDVLVKYTFVGDADLDGVVDADDYLQIDDGFNSQTGGSPLTGWANGDFNYDGQINGDDYTLIDNAYNSQGSTSFASTSAGPAEMIAADTAQIATSVPEPTLSLLGLSAVAFVGRRSRRLNPRR